MSCRTVRRSSTGCRHAGRCRSCPSVTERASAKVPETDRASGRGSATPTASGRESAWASPRAKAPPSRPPALVRPSQRASQSPLHRRPRPLPGSLTRGPGPARPGRLRQPSPRPAPLPAGPCPSGSRRPHQPARAARGAPAPWPRIDLPWCVPRRPDTRHDRRRRSSAAGTQGRAAIDRREARNDGRARVVGNATSRRWHEDGGRAPPGRHAGRLRRPGDRGDPRRWLRPRHHSCAGVYASRRRPHGPGQALGTLPAPPGRAEPTRGRRVPRGSARTVHGRVERGGRAGVNGHPRRIAVLPSIKAAPGRRCNTRAAVGPMRLVSPQ